MERDYTGVPTRDLAEIFQQHQGDSGLTDIASKVPPKGMDVRDLRKIVIEPIYTFTGLKMADAILTTVGLNITALEWAGEIVVIAAPNKKAPYLMAEDEFWVQGVEPTPEELEARAKELADIRDVLLK